MAEIRGLEEGRNIAGRRSRRGKESERQRVSGLIQRILEGEKTVQRIPLHRPAQQETEEREERGEPGEGAGKGQRARWSVSARGAEGVWSCRET